MPSQTEMSVEKLEADQRTFTSLGFHGRAGVRLFVESVFTDVWYGNRTRNSQIPILVLYR